MIVDVPARFRLPYQKVENLQAAERYSGAFIFGSVARGDTSDDSDFDVKVVVDTDNPCTNINHPIINGVKLDLTFQSMRQLTAFTEQEIRRAERIPMIAESIIVFDKTGELAALKAKAQEAKPKKAAPEDYPLIQFMIYHAEDKVTRALRTDEAAALVSMGIGLGELISIHYQIQGKWQVSDKRLFSDLKEWDAGFLNLLRDFALAVDINDKYALWERIIDTVLTPIGGRQPISENNCTCERCVSDLTSLLSVSV